MNVYSQKQDPPNTTFAKKNAEYQGFWHKARYFEITSSIKHFLNYYQSNKIGMNSSEHCSTEKIFPKPLIT